MKKSLLRALSALLLLIAVVFCGCIIVIPDSDSIGESKTFEADGITLLLTDRFVEQESEVGFDAYYVSDFCGVMVLKEEFTLKEGLSEKPLSEYIEGVIENNGHTNIEPQNKDGLWFYVKDNDDTRIYSYSYKGSDAFFIVQFACYLADIEALEDIIHLWAQAVEVE
ncbi:MAG: hypothetical protein IJA35_05590 [Clostridia bacterium]|nr:hypothetical protein [Clostridia bacterium]